MIINNIIDKIYSNSHFTTILIGAIAFLVVLFIIVLYLGIKDAKKAKNPVKEDKEEKDITFEDAPQEPKDIAEDVTFEMGTITKNLEDEIQINKEFKILKQKFFTIPMPKKKTEEELQNDTSEIEIVNEEIPKEEPKEEVKEEPEKTEDEIEDSFLDLIDLKKDEEKEEPKKDKEEEIELPKMNEDNKKEDLNSAARKKKEKMIDEYLSATKALSLDEINKKIEEMEKDDF